jgi:tetratricopeptide (TPR) repeat protein
MFSPTNARLRNQVVDRLLRGRAAIETDTGWAFTHPLVRESLVRRARDGGRWAGINRGAARMLRGRAEEDADLVAERIGMHLLEAGMADASVAPLLRGILERGNASGYRPALALAATCEHALTIAGAPQSDSRWGSLALERARLEYHHGAFEAAARQVERVLASARRHGWGRIVRDALVLRADIHTRRGAHDAAAEDLAVVRREAIAEGDRVGQGLAALGLGRVARVLGHLDDASERIVEACKLLTGRELEPELAACWREMGSIELQQGDPTRAATLFSKARAAFERRGRSLDVAACLNGLAEVRQAEAERGYERSLALYQAIGSGDEAVVRLNLSALAVERGDWAAASEQGERASRALSDQGHLQLAAGAKVVLTAAAAGARDWRAFDDHLRAAVRALHGLSSFDHDNATMAERAGDLAEAAGESERAADVYSLAWVQWQGLGDGDGQRRVGAKMG